MINILHGADLHLDSPFSDFPAGTAAMCREEQRQILRRLRSVCIQRQSHVMLLAGDIFDGIPYPETVELLRRELALSPVPVFIVPGNHDPLESGLWDGEWPEHVHIFKGPGCVTLEELGLCVHHGDLPGLRGRDDGYIHIGLIHGDEPFTEKEIAATGLDYLALGHIHKTAMPRRAGKTWYGWPGIPMGRGFDETGFKGVFSVELSRERCDAELIGFGLMRCEIYHVDVSEDWKPPRDSSRICARVYLVGNAGQTDAETFYETYAGEFLRLEVKDETTPQEDLWEACGDGTLRGLALDRVKACEDGALAELAAKYLLAALEGREAP